MFLQRFPTQIQQNLLTWLRPFKHYFVISSLDRVFFSAQLHLLLFHACVEKLQTLLTHTTTSGFHTYCIRCAKQLPLLTSSSHMNKCSQSFTVRFVFPQQIGHCYPAGRVSNTPRRKDPAWTIWATASGFSFTGGEPECVLMLDIEGPGYTVT